MLLSWVLRARVCHQVAIKAWVRVTHKAIIGVLVEASVISGVGWVRTCGQACSVVVGRIWIFLGCWTEDLSS